MRGFCCTWNNRVLGDGEGGRYVSSACDGDDSGLLVGGIIGSCVLGSAKTGARLPWCSELGHAWGGVVGEGQGLMLR